MAMLSGRRAFITDVSVEGIGITHEAPLAPGSEAYLEFTWGGSLLVLRCTVAATRRLSPALHRSGLVITGGSDVEAYQFRARKAVESLLDYEAKLPPAI